MTSELNALTDAISEALALGKSDLNEASTCDWIIKPLLEAAGYERYEILPQFYDTAGKIPDYTVLPNSDHTWFLEAKAWGVALNDQHAQQALIYAYTNNRRWVVLTNGREWRLYDNSIPGELSGKLVAKARLEDVGDAKEFLTAIGRQSVMNGSLERWVRQRRLKATLERELGNQESDLVKAIKSKLRSEQYGLSWVTQEEVAAYFRGQPREDRSETGLATGGLQGEPSQEEPPTSGPPPADQAAGYSLADLTAHSDQLVTKRSPAAVIFPDGNEVATAYWIEVAKTVVRWLAERGRLPELPFVPSRGARVFLNSRPEHLREGLKVQQFAKIRCGSTVVYINTNNSAKDIVRSLYLLLQAAGEDADAVRVRIGD